jgi:hypothetical protein
MTIELDRDKGQGLSLAGLEALRCYLHQPRTATAARYIGVSQRYASAVLSAWQLRGEVPPAQQSLRGLWDRDGGDVAVLSQFTREQVQSIRMWIIEEARAGRNVFSRGLRAQIKSLTGHVLNRRKLQAIREPLGIVFSKVVGAGGAKLSRRVRLERYRFIVRRMHEDSREPHLRHIRVYSDETYCHANHAAKSTWVISERVWEATILQNAADQVDFCNFLHGSIKIIIW